MRLPERDPYAPREWQPHEKPALLGSPSTPEHSTPKRIAYGVVGLLVCLTGALGNAVVTANLQNLQGTFGAWFSGAVRAGHLLPPVRKRSQLGADGARRARHGGRRA